ncbi:bifunctional sugar phosphate isomerase/epimerase/4-hydroxyphenylpyruvate dioxygenase family protein [Roseibium sp.]|uniref:bifunctional sugar phosphate isomerase/epimerase/4-hydroxyphenylpyruvate dioxygenase family protein n=1 Tax=Roseibium sp. TaxID=1936156 RepID=UPI003B512ECA
MKTSIATVSIAGDLPRKLAAISAAGFDGIEIFEQDFIAHDGGATDVGKMVRDHGLEILLFQPLRDFEGLPDPQRSRAFERAKRKFDVMNNLGTDLVLICSSVHPKALGGIDRAASDLAELGDIARAHGVRVGYEALAWGRYINDHRDAWEVVRRADHPSIGLIVDSFHTLGRKLSPDSLQSIPGDRIFFVQLADAPQIDMDLLYWSRHFRNMPGEGDLDVTDFLKAVAATGYDGPVSLEIFNDQFRGGSPEMIARDGYRSLMALADDVEREAPHSRIGIQPMPERPRVARIEFIEFTADETSAAEFEQLLASLGFRLAAQHINKSVAVWQQGGIRIVINKDGKGFARACFKKHGLGVCDIGLRVDNANAAVDRATRLGAEPFHQPLNDGEMALPAIHAVSGSIMHLIDEPSGLSNVWDVEFKPVESGGDAGLLQTVDHIAQTMDYAEMLSWSLFYTAQFALNKRPVFDVVDPGGIVRSQVIEAPDGSFRLTLNGADSKDTLAGQFIADRAASAVQHIAFSCAEIFATAAALKARGFEPLELPDNYYDDLAARFGFDDPEIQRLKQSGVLYDEDDQGAFYQIYSRPVAGGFFFEIVQRTGNYTGYGGPNAPFRTAAMKRLMRQDAP